MRIATVAASLLLAWACRSPETEPSPAPGLGPPAAYIGATAADAGPDACLPPEGPYGTSLGRVFPPLVLPACDGSDRAFYGADFCEARVTLVSFVAGWCSSALVQTAELEAGFTAPYRSRGVRVIQIILQTESYDPPDERYCAEWVARFGLTNDVLIDPDQTTSFPSPSGALPFTLIVDAAGAIRHRASGYTRETRAQLESALEAILAEPP